MTSPLQVLQTLVSFFNPGEGHPVKYNLGSTSVCDWAFCSSKHGIRPLFLLEAAQRMETHIEGDHSKGFMV